MAILLVGWLGALPGFLVISAVLSRWIAKKGDYFRVDRSRRTLELCRAGRTIQGSEIEAIILLSRWHRWGLPWIRFFQTSVLVRGPGGQMELYPVMSESTENAPAYTRSRWADRLASIFPVPVRRIELSKAESQALNDC